MLYISIAHKFGKKNISCVKHQNIANLTIPPISKCGFSTNRTRKKEKNTKYLVKITSKKRLKKLLVYLIDKSGVMLYNSIIQ